MKHWIRWLNVLASMLTLVSYWSLNSMQLPSIEDDVRMVREIKIMEKNIQPSPDSYKPIKDKVSKYLDTLFTAYSKSFGEAQVVLDGRINNFIQNLPTPVQAPFFDKFQSIQIQLAEEKNPSTRLKKISLQEVQHDVAREVWSTAPAKLRGQQEITQIIKNKLDTPEFRGLKLCLRAALGPVLAKEWFADLPGEQAFASDDPEMQKLVRELKENNDDVVVVIVGAGTNAKQIVPSFIFKNFTQFKDKKATVILIDPAYSDLSFNDEKNILLAAGIGKIIERKGIEIENNVIKFAADDAYSNITMKFFGTSLPSKIHSYNDQSYNYLRRFCEKQINARKNIFFGWMVDVYCCTQIIGFSKVYKELKDRYPDNIFFYGSASPADDCFVVFDPLARFTPNKPLALRFFSLGFCLLVDLDFDFSKISKIVQLKKPFLLCKDLNFTFVKNNNDLLVSLDDAYAVRDKNELFWQKYATNRDKMIPIFIEKLKNALGDVRADLELEKLGTAVQVDQEPKTWREAVEQSKFFRSWDEYQKTVPN